LILDYGRQFSNRFQAMITLVASLYICLLVIILLSLLKIYKIEQLFLFQCIVDSTVMVFLMIGVFFQGASINDSFSVHREILKQNKTIILDIQLYRKAYSNPKF